MPQYNIENERMKRAYYRHLKAARGLSEVSIDAAAKAIHRFECSTGFRSFKKLHVEQAIPFRRRLEEATAVRTDEPLSKATISHTLQWMRAFIVWLAEQPGYRSRIRYSDADYFRLSEKDERIAKAPKEPKVPTADQIEHVLQNMPAETEIQRRDRALIAFTWLTGVRDGALASLKVKHVNLANGCVNQDPREVKTKNSKAIITWFFPVGGSAQRIFEEWIAYLVKESLWGLDDPLFPATLVEQDAEHRFQTKGLSRNHWANADPVRRVFKQAFDAAGMPYFNPHSFRHALVRLGERVCKNPEEFKAWSQNLGHESPLTTFTSYGQVSAHRQAEIIIGLANGASAEDDQAELVRKFADFIRRN